MAGQKPYTKYELEEIVGILKKSRTLDDAALETMKRFHRPTSRHSLLRLFKSRGMDSPGSYLRMDPVESAVKREQESKLREDYNVLVDRVRDAEEQLAVLDALDGTEIKQIKRREKQSGVREGTAVILASDWHIEEHVPSRPDTNFNLYNLQVAEKRVGRFFEGAEWLIQHNRPVFGLRDVVLWLGGDLITGYLRAENLEENELSPVEALVWLQRNLVLGIRRMLDDKQLEQLTIVCSHGNHGRTTEKPRRATGAKNSYEWLLYQWLRTFFEDEPRIQFITDQSNHQYLQVYDFMLHFHHGDEINYQGGVGGITIPLKKAVFGWDEVRKSHYHHFGHFHQYIDLGNIAVNGSLIGYNAYAMSIRATLEPPQQTFYILDSKRGKTAKYPIWVGD